MVEEDKKLKPIDVRPFMKVTPEMEEAIDKFAEQVLPVVDKLVRDIEIISDSE